MSLAYLITINFFESENIQKVLKEHNIDSKIKTPYHQNITAGWVDPSCNYNERQLFVNSKDFVQAKKILLENFKIKFV